METFLSVKEIAKIFKITEITVRRWIKRGWLPAIKIGKMYRIKSKDLDKLGKQKKLIYKYD